MDTRVNGGNVTILHISVGHISTCIDLRIGRLWINCYGAKTYTGRLLEQKWGQLMYLTILISPANCLALSRHVSYNRNGGFIQWYDGN